MSEVSREKLTTQRPQRIRPSVHDFATATEFFAQMLAHHKATSNFSLRQQTRKLGLCSQSLVSHILNGRRKLTRDNLAELAQILKLTKSEYEYFGRRLSSRHHAINPETKTGSNAEVAVPRAVRVPQNHLLNDRLHPYVKDLIHLRGFKLDAEVLFTMLHGFFPAARIKKSVEFLLKHGFWRRTCAHTVTFNEVAVTTTSDVPNKKIRAFHKMALEIALRGLKDLPVDRRKASTVLLSIDQEQLHEVREMIDSFQQQLLEFIEKNPRGGDHLVQVTTHLTPVGKSL
jgi:uncharacterized protein (TIGR02147 family)